MERGRQVSNLSGQQKLGIVRYSWPSMLCFLLSLLLAGLAHPNLSASVTMRPDTFQESTDLLFWEGYFPRPVLASHWTSLAGKHAPRRRVREAKNWVE